MPSKKDSPWSILRSDPGWQSLAADAQNKLDPEKSPKWFHKSQRRLWNAKERFVLVLAGTQSGKTCTGPYWLLREIARRGPGDYAVISPTFSLMEVKALPELRRVFSELNLGRYVGYPVRKFTLSPQAAQKLYGSPEPSAVHFGYATNPDSLESATYKAIWCDEAGQPAFKEESWDALLRRLSIHSGRALVTTTPYAWTWIKHRLYDRADSDPEIALIHFESIQNPVFPKAEWERAKAELPAWKFDLFYRARFTRPAGLIYESFDEACVIANPRIEPEWPRYWGIDFGGINTVVVMYAQRPSDQKLILYRTYKSGNRTAAQHVRALLQREPVMPKLVVGGAASEGQWRGEFAAAGLPIRKPTISDVEVGIDRVFGVHAQNGILVSSQCTAYLQQKRSYARELDAQGSPLPTILEKSTYHYMDAERYIISEIRPGSSTKLQVHNRAINTRYNSPSNTRRQGS